MPSKIAASQFGVVSRRQLVAAGMSTSAIDRRVADGRLIRLHRGVYAVGHEALVGEGRWFAAVLAGGEGAVLSHRDAAHAWGLRPTARPRVEITVRGDAGRGRPGVQAHRCALHPRGVTEHLGIPITTVARTLLDLAEVVPSRELDKAIEQAEKLALYDHPSVLDVLARAHGRRGSKPLGAALAKIHAEPGLTRSRMERRFRALLDDLSIERPETNVELHGHEVDALWDHLRLVVELDSYEHHTTRRAFRNDRRRDAALAEAGYRVLRLTWTQVTQEPDYVAERLIRAGCSRACASAPARASSAASRAP